MEGVSAVWPALYGPWDGGLNKPDEVLPAMSGPHNQRAVGNQWGKAGRGMVVPDWALGTYPYTLTAGKAS